MNTFSVVSIAISFTIGLLVVLKIRQYDIFEKEPFLDLVNATLLGGAVSSLISMN